MATVEEVNGQGGREGCRGPTRGDCRKVFSVSSLSLSGSEFQTVGSATENAQRPSFVDSMVHTVLTAVIVFNANFEQLHFKKVQFQISQNM